MKTLKSIRTMFLAVAVASAPAAAPASLLDDLNPFNQDNPLNPEKQKDQLEKATKKLHNELKNGVKDVGKEGKKLLKKWVDEIGNSAEDLRILIEQGKCGGDICDALDALVEVTEKGMKNTNNNIIDAKKRLSEGKIVDAWWHLIVDPADQTQENAADAAIKSSVLRGIGQAAASAYGGPYGAAAYAGWLTYNATDGDINASLKAAVIAGGTSYLMSEIAEADGVDVIQGVQADEIVQKGVLTAAVSGVAVAAAGGSEEEIEQALTTGAVTYVIRSAYFELTKSNLEDNLKHSKGVGYCLAGNPNAVNSVTGNRLGCLPGADDYVPKDGVSVKYNEDGTINLDSIKRDGDNYAVDFTKLDYRRPHVGIQGKINDPNFIGVEETSGAMEFVSRIPGMNAMSVGHDIFDGELTPKLGVGIIDRAVTVGTIIPFVSITYEGAGVGIQEQIREAIKKSRRLEKEALSGQGSVEMAKDSDGIIAETPSEQERAIADFVKNTVQFLNLRCKSNAESVLDNNFLMETKAQRSFPIDHTEKVCRIDQYLGNDQWENYWHAHYDRNSCVAAFNRLIREQLKKDYQCSLNKGTRFDPPELAKYQ